LARLYADENFPLPVVLELRRLGHDVLTTHEAGRSDQSIPDEEVLTFAATEGRAVLTLNRLHFIRLHRAAAKHPGIIVCTYDRDFAAQAARIDAVIGGQTDLSDQLLRVNRPSA
jgi:predicted nuclease of predicted toxin-antitoxin system